jgi:hypothetical protein
MSDRNSTWLVLVVVVIVCMAIAVFFLSSPGPKPPDAFDLSDVPHIERGIPYEPTAEELRGLAHLKRAAAQLGGPDVASSFRGELLRFLREHENILGPDDRKLLRTAHFEDDEDVLRFSLVRDLCRRWSAPEPFPVEGVVFFKVTDDSELRADGGDPSLLQAYLRDCCSDPDVLRKLRAELRAFSGLLLHIQELPRLRLVGAVDGFRLLWEDLDELGRSAQSDAEEDAIRPVADWFPVLSERDVHQLRALDRLWQLRLRRLLDRGRFQALYDGQTGPFRAWKQIPEPVVELIYREIDADRASLLKHLQEGDVRPDGEFKDLDRAEMERRIALQYKSLRQFIEVVAGAPHPTGDASNK